MEKLTCYEFGDMLQLADKRFKAIESDSLACFGLTHFHAKYISHLYRHKQMTMRELTENIGVDKANTTRVMRDLQAKGLVERASGGIRNYALRLSNKGREIAEHFKQRIENITKKIFANFSDEERVTLFTLLNKLMMGVKNA